MYSAGKGEWCFQAAGGDQARACAEAAWRSLHWGGSYIVREHDSAPIRDAGIAPHGTIVATASHGQLELAAGAAAPEMMTSGPAGLAGTAPVRDSGRDPRPSSLEDLIAALSQLPALGDVDRARAIPGLIEAAKTVLAQTRAGAMAAATAPGGISRAELARQLGISRSKVTEPWPSPPGPFIPGRTGAQGRNVTSTNLPE